MNFRKFITERDVGGVIHGFKGKLKVSGQRKKEVKLIGRNSGVTILTDDDELQYFVEDLEDVVNNRKKGYLHESRDYNIMHKGETIVISNAQNSSELILDTNELLENLGELEKLIERITKS